MQLRHICLVVVLVVLIIMAHPVSAAIVPTATAKITKVNAPTTVGVGQPLTIDVTVSYSTNGGWKSLIVDIQDRVIGEPNVFPTIAKSCSVPVTMSYCSYSGNFFGVGNITASFTLTAPNQPTTWVMYAYAGFFYSDTSGGTVGQVQVGTSDQTRLQVVVTASQIQPTTSTIPITSSTLLSTSTTSSPLMLQPSQSITVSQPASIPALQLGGLFIAIILVIVLFVVALVLISRRDKQLKVEPKKNAPTKSFCIECGNKLPPKSKFCNNCGTKQP